MVHRLALAMHRPVGELNVSVNEFIDWMAFEQLHPFPDMRQEFMMAQLIAMYVSAHAKKKPNISDFMLSEMIKKSGQTTEATDEQITNIFKAVQHG